MEQLVFKCPLLGIVVGVQGGGGGGGGGICDVERIMFDKNV